MKIDLEEKIQAITLRRMQEVKMLNEDLESLKSRYNNPKFKIEAEQWAKEMNNKGANSGINLDSDGTGFEKLELAIEILIAAYIQGSGEFSLANSKESFTINKENIEDAILTAIQPGYRNFANFFGYDILSKAPADILDKILTIMTPDSYTKREDARQEYEKWTGEPLLDNKIKRIKYYITKYINDPRGYMFKDFSFFKYLKTYYKRRVADIIQAKIDKEKKEKAKKVSYDANIKGDSNNTYLSGMAAKEAEDNAYQRVMQAAVKSLGNEILNQNLIGAKYPRENDIIKAYFKTLLDISADMPNLNTSAKRNNEILLRYNSSSDETDKVLFNLLWDFERPKDKITNREKYNNDASEMWKKESKEIKRKAQRELYSNMNQIIQIGEKLEMSIKEMPEIIIAYIIDKPSKAIALLKDVIGKIKNIEQEKQEIETGEAINTDLNKEKDNLSKYDIEDEINPDDIYNQGNIEKVDIDDYKDQLEEGVESEENKPYPSLAIIGKVFSQYIKAEDELEQLNEVKKIVKSIISETFLK
jgi:ElaB/YqjD/DUF883 family membrane-anchored ribosome-binding protein